MTTHGKPRNSSDEPLYTLKSFNVLLTDDYDFMQSLMGGMLRAFGVGNTMVCSSTKEAIELLTITLSQMKAGNCKPIDMVLVDWMMPDGSGVDVIKWIRNHKSDQIRFMPIILVSAFASEDVVIAARDYGANEALVKPVSGQKLANRILSVIDHPRPFVQAPSFFGPDRRRQEKSWKGEDRRKISADQIETHNERL